MQALIAALLLTASCGGGGGSSSADASDDFPTVDAPTQADSGEIHDAPPADAAGPSEFCPPLAAPTGTTVTVTTPAELIDQAYNAAADTTILIAAGTYALTNTVEVTHSGVTLRSVSGDRDDVVLDFAGNSNPNGISIDAAASEVTIADLTVKNAASNDIGVQGSDRTTLYNLHVLDSVDQLIKVNPVSDGSDDGLLACSLIEYTDSAPDDYTNGISAHDAHDWVVRDNTWRRIRGNVDVYLPTILFWSASSGTRVYRNRLYDCAGGIAFGNASHGAGDHTGGLVANNFIYRGIWGDVGIAMTHATGWTVAYNTVFLAGSSSDGLTWSIEARFADTSGTFAYNLTNMDIISRDSADATMTGNLTDAVEGWFETPASGDLHLTAAATDAIDGGAPLAAVPNDIDGDSRGDSPDVGADERMP